MTMKLKSSKGTKTVPEMTDVQPKLLSNISLNDLKTPGQYYFSTTSGVTDCEIATAGGVIVLRVGAGTPGAFTQIVVSGRFFYIRSTATDSSWTGWKKATLEDA